MIPFNKPYLDFSAGGMTRKEITVIGGRPGHGKTTLVTNIIKGLIEQGYKVMMFNREMSNTEMLKKFVVMESPNLLYANIRQNSVGETNEVEFEDTIDKIKDKYKNLIVYSVVNNILNFNKILAPRLISNHYKNDMIEISDLGNKSFFEFIILKKNKINDYKSLIRIIFKIQKIKLKKEYNLGKFKVKFLKYTLDNLHKESDLFFDWFLRYFLKHKNKNKIKKLLRTELNNIYKKLNFKNDTFVHRDFHISNIMIYKKKFGLIDSQDAIIGNPLYDLASLIDDVRIKLPQNLQNKLFKYYWQGSKYKNEKEEMQFNCSILKRFFFLTITCHHLLITKIE